MNKALDIYKSKHILIKLPKVYYLINKTTQLIINTSDLSLINTISTMDI